MVDPDTKDITGEKVDFIEAEFVTIKQSSVRSVEGGHVEVQQVGALSIDGERIEVTQGASAIIRGDEVNLNQSISLLTTGNTTSVNSSFSPVVLSRAHATVDRSAVGIMGAREIKAENASSLLMIASRVEGTVTTLLDWKSALALGAVIGGAMGFLSLFRKR
ncbi:MAG TPA: hypothetical protein VED67_03305 [Thermodesulfovibrionales bacterium]|nr:hypothetical protein [Thermodesulfovibrionales bacterium]